MCFPPSSYAKRTAASCSLFCPYIHPHKLGGLFPRTTTVGRKVDLFSLTNPSAPSLEPSIFRGERADLSSLSKLSQADSPDSWTPCSGRSFTPCPASQVPSHSSPPHSLGQAPYYTGASEICSFPLAHSPRSQIGSAEVAAAPGPSVQSRPVPSRSLPLDPRSSLPRAPNPDKGWLRLSPALLGSSLFSFACNTSGPWRPQPPSRCRAPPCDGPSPGPPRLRCPSDSQAISYQLMGPPAPPSAPPPAARRPRPPRPPQATPSLESDHAHWSIGSQPPRDLKCEARPLQEAHAYWSIRG